MKDSKQIKLEWSVPRARSLSQNALFHLWCGELAGSFTGRSKGKEEYTKQDLKVLLKHKFLGYETKVIGKTEIPPQLKSSSKLDKGEMFHLMSQIERWASEVGVILSNPADAEYTKLKEYQHET